MHPEAKIQLCHLSFAYGDNLVLDGLNAEFHANRITAITGPSGQGKSTLLSAINRLADEIPGARVTGEVTIHFSDKSLNVYADKYYLPDLRRRVGLVFQKPNPLPVSILNNVTLPLRMAGRSGRDDMRDRARDALAAAFLWDEVADRLDQSALELSGGQQQRLCIARALVLEPEVLMLDEPTSSLDSSAAGQIEELLVSLRERCTVLFVSHYLEQVNRIADVTYGIENKQLVRAS
ncbi:ATP-binding cassette domain-containing protein [bacterium]|nr:ATP-binding cassette domain-containing protein [bacterium]